jgi:hypothetical protein
MPTTLKFVAVCWFSQMMMPIAIMLRKKPQCLNKNYKVAGFVHESLPIDTKQAFMDFYFSETIHRTGNLKPGFASPPVWIHKDSGFPNPDF